MGMMSKAKSKAKAQEEPVLEDEQASEVPVEEEPNPSTEPVESEAETEEGGGVQASPEEQEEYDRAMDALYQVLYNNDKTSKAVADQLNAQNKVDSVARAGILIIKSLDERISMDEEIIPQMTREVADSLIEMAEAKGIPEFSESEAKAVLGATWEGVMAVFGMSKEDAEDLRMDSSPEELKGMEDQYRQFLSEAEQPSAAPGPQESQNG
jgi:hypothetical protein